MGGGWGSTRMVVWGELVPVREKRGNGVTLVGGLRAVGETSPRGGIGEVWLLSGVGKR